MTLTGHQEFNSLIKQLTHSACHLSLPGTIIVYGTNPCQYNWTVW